MPNGDPDWHETELPQLEAFFAPMAEEVREFATKNRLTIDRYDHQTPGWSLRFAHPRGGEAYVEIRRFVEAGARRVGLGLVLLVAAIAVPHPEGIWYFGHRPQWLVAIDSARLSIGPSDHPKSLGAIPLIVAKLLLTSVPAWALWRRRLRIRHVEPTADRTDIGCR